MKKKKKTRFLSLFLLLSSAPGTRPRPRRGSRESSARSWGCRAVVKRGGKRGKVACEREMGRRQAKGRANAFDRSEKKMKKKTDARRPRRCCCSHRPWFWGAQPGGGRLVRALRSSCREVLSLSLSFSLSPEEPKKRGRERRVVNGKRTFVESLLLPQCFFLFSPLERASRPRLSLSSFAREGEP